MLCFGVYGSGVRGIPLIICYGLGVTYNGINTIRGGDARVHEEAERLRNPLVGIAAVSGRTPKDASVSWAMQQLCAGALWPMPT